MTTVLTPTDVDAWIAECGSLADKGHWEFLERVGLIGLTLEDILSFEITEESFKEDLDKCICAPLALATILFLETDGEPEFPDTTPGMTASDARNAWMSVMRQAYFGNYRNLHAALQRFIEVYMSMVLTMVHGLVDHDIITILDRDILRNPLLIALNVPARNQLRDALDEYI